MFQLIVATPLPSEFTLAPTANRVAYLSAEHYEDLPLDVAASFIPKPSPQPGLS